jgi:hypothetical protein
MMPPGPDPAQVTAELRRRFPGLQVWHGDHTGTWWAAVLDAHRRDRLIEATDPADLRRRLEAISAHPATRPIRAQTSVAGRAGLPRVARPAAPPTYRRTEQGWFSRLLDR